MGNIYNVVWKTNRMNLPEYSKNSDKDQLNDWRSWTQVAPSFSRQSNKHIRLGKWKTGPRSLRFPLSICIIIIHRLHAIQNAAHIVVLHHGQVQEQGQRKELLCLKGIDHVCVTSTPTLTPKSVNLGDAVTTFNDEWLWSS